MLKIKRKYLHSCVKKQYERPVKVADMPLGVCKLKKKICHYLYAYIKRLAGPMG